MTKFGWTVVLIALVLIGGIAAFFLLRPSVAPEPAPAETGNEELEGRSIYASGEYGFTVRYPSKAAIEETFSAFYHVGTAWRANALVNATGTPLLGIIAYETKSEDSFPRYYDAMVRIGVSDDEEEVAVCEKVGKDIGETALPERDINGTIWKAFSFQSAGMMQYVKGVSYRVVHDGKCFALEKMAAGSNYQDDPDSAKDVSQETLDAEYAALDAIIETFEFSGS